LEHWRTLHATRSYCNMTHITVDLYDSSSYIWQHSVDAGRHLYAESKTLAEKGATKVYQVYQEQMDKHWPTIKPHYDEHIVGNFQKHIAPHLQEHVYPRIGQFSKWYKKEVVPRFQHGKRNAQQGYQKLIELYGEECQSSLLAYKQASKENDFLKEHPLPKSVLQTWTHSCSHPEETMESAMYGLLLLLGITFYRHILNVIGWTLNLVLAILMTFTPLRFFISRRKYKTPKNKKMMMSSVHGNVDDDMAIPDIAPSSSGSPDSWKNPVVPNKNTRNTKKPQNRGPK
jgi:hypothetical protein